MRAVRPGRRTPPAATAGVWHVETDDDRAVLKLVRNGGADGRRPAHSDPSHPYYWRREPLAYTTGVVDPFGAPRCRACVERADGSVALWLDDAGESPPWTPERLGAVARRLGAAQALSGPEAPWLVPGFLREYLRLHDVAPDEQVLAALDALPQTLCHNDFHPGNVLGGGAVVDWAYCGIGAVGLDAGVLVADGMADGAFPAELADEVADAVWEGYTAGLGYADDGVHFAFARGTALRLAWLPRGQRAAWDATADFLQRLASGL